MATTSRSQITQPIPNGGWVPNIGNVTSYTQKGKLTYRQVKQEPETEPESALWIESKCQL